MQPHANFTVNHQTHLVEKNIDQMLIKVFYAFWLSLLCIYHLLIYSISVLVLNQCKQNAGSRSLRKFQLTKCGESSSELMRYLILVKGPLWTPASPHIKHCILQSEQIVSSNKATRCKIVK